MNSHPSSLHHENETLLSVHASMPTCSPDECSCKKIPLERKLTPLALSADVEVSVKTSDVAARIWKTISPVEHVRVSIRERSDGHGVVIV